MKQFLAEFHQQGALYALEGVLPMWAVRLIPNCVIDAIDYLR